MHRFGGEGGGHCCSILSLHYVRPYASSTTAIECEPLPNIANGSISYAPDMTPNFDLGTTATYECDDGFYLMGEDERNCTAGDGSSAIGMFNGEEPTCVRKCTVEVRHYTPA